MEDVESAHICFDLGCSQTFQISSVRGLGTWAGVVVKSEMQVFDPNPWEPGFDGGTRGCYLVLVLMAKVRQVVQWVSHPR